MKIIFLTACIIISSILNVCGQNDVLILKKKKSGKEKIIQEGKRIKIITDSARIIKGKFDIVNDSILVIEKDTVDIKDIAKIRAKPIGSYIAGGLLTGGGIALTATGSVIIVQAALTEEYMIMVLGLLAGSSMIVVGVPIAVSGVLVMTIGKKYTREKWDFRILIGSSP
jgi:hypothetical protein